MIDPVFYINLSTTLLFFLKLMFAFSDISFKFFFKYNYIIFPNLRHNPLAIVLLKIGLVLFKS
jgi:hypothetical protein